MITDPGFIAAGRIDVFGRTTFDGETEVKVVATVVVNDASSLRLSNTVALDFANISLKATTGTAALIIDGTISGTGHIEMMQGTELDSESIIHGFTSVTPLKIEDLISINGVGKLGANHLGDVTNHEIVENDTGGTLEIDLSPGHKFVNASSGKVEVVIGEMRIATDTPFVNASGELFVFQGATFESEGLCRQTAGSTTVRSSMTAPFFAF